MQNSKSPNRFDDSMPKKEGFKRCQMSFLKVLQFSAHMEPRMKKCSKLAARDGDGAVRPSLHLPPMSARRGLQFLYSLALVMNNLNIFVAKMKKGSQMAFSVANDSNVELCENIGKIELSRASRLMGGQFTKSTLD